MQVAGGGQGDTISDGMRKLTGGINLLLLKLLLRFIIKIWPVLGPLG